ncbi:MAG: twin transmembrane helix small protein [Alphaproteobacteria bacterium]|nr:twin transmembrane helix small protein [Alphaproteobacteria bacterium]
MNILVTVLPYLIGLSLLAVVATLFTGLVSMTKGGDFNKRYGNKLMRLRVVLQAVTIALFMAYILLTQVS